MKRTLTIFRKELKDTLRDRRTIFMMVVMPLLFIPLLFTMIFKITQAQKEKAEARELRIAYVGKDYSPELFGMFHMEERLLLIQGIPPDSIAPMIRREELDGGIIIDQEFPQLIRSDKQDTIRIVYKAAEEFGNVEERLSEVIERYDSMIVSERISRLNLDPNLFEAITIEKVDMASIQEKVAQAAGGFLPYIIIIFGFLGAMYPGIDLGAGEKERGTLETLLSSPANRLEIVLGKFGVVMLASIATALIAMLGIYFTVRAFPEMPTRILDVIMDMLGPRMILLILTLLLPIAAFFGAVILALSIYARSFKEAQSIITPLNIAIIVPAIIGLLPGIELNARTALIPILNVSLAI